MNRLHGMHDTEIDDHRQRLFLLVAVLVWCVVLGWVVLRDPAWRILHRERLAAPVEQPTAGWIQLDRRLIERLSSAEIEPVGGWEELEEAIVAAMERRRIAGGSERRMPRPELGVCDELRALARTRAAARLELSAAEENVAPELRHPELVLTLRAPDRLVRSLGIFQPLPASPPFDGPSSNNGPKAAPSQRLRPTAASEKPPAAAGFADELVGGWMNRPRFANLLLAGEKLHVGAGAVPAAGGGMVEILLVETLVELDAPLPAIVGEQDTVKLAGHRLSGEEVKFYFKGPADPGFYPLDVLWSEERFAHGLSWDQGRGNYAVRASRGERLSDLRPIFVE